MCLFLQTIAIPRSETVCARRTLCANNPLIEDSCQVGDLSCARSYAPLTCAVPFARMQPALGGRTCASCEQQCPHQRTHTFTLVHCALFLPLCQSRCRSLSPRCPRSCCAVYGVRVYVLVCTTLFVCVCTRSLFNPKIACPETCSHTNMRVHTHIHIRAATSAHFLYSRRNIYIYTIYKRHRRHSIGGVVVGSRELRCAAAA